MAAPTTRRKPTAPAEPVEVDEFEELEDDLEEDADIEGSGDDDLTEVEEAEEAPKPKAKRTPPVQPTIEFGSPWLASYITEQTGESYDGRGIRMLLRKLAKDGIFNREVGVERARYEFTGPTDPTVVAVLAMVKSGAAKELKQAGLQKVKDDAAAKKAAKAAAKAAAAEAAEDDVEEMEEVEEAPKPTPRKKAAPAAGPAKATPATATRRRTAAAK